MVTYVEPMVVPYNEPNPIKKIERMARICYQSVGKTTEGSGDKLIKSIITSGHHSCLEHYRFKVYGKMGFDSMLDIVAAPNPDYLKIKIDANGDEWLYGNIRAFRDAYVNVNGECEAVRVLLSKLAAYHPIFFEDLVTPSSVRLPDPMFQIEEADDYQSFIIDTDIGVCKEFTRHRANMSFSVESTRYCNYNKKGMVFCLPYPYVWGWDDTKYNTLQKVCSYIVTNTKDRFIKIDGKEECLWYKKDGSDDWTVTEVGQEYITNLVKRRIAWDKANRMAEASYNEMLESGAHPQEARAVLPHSLKCQMGVTATTGAWAHFFHLRYDKAHAHPQIFYIAEKALDYLKDLMPAKIVHRYDEFDFQEIDKILDPK